MVDVLLGSSRLEGCGRASEAVARKGPVAVDHLVVRSTTIWLWWVAAGTVWLITIPLCAVLSQDLVDAPPPSLETWKNVAALLPVVAILVALMTATIARLRRRSSAIALGLAAKGLLWASIAIALVAVPKAP